MQTLSQFQITVFSILEIFFVYCVARFFCEIIKLPKEMPKIAKYLKCLKLRYSIDLNRKDRAQQYHKSSIFPPQADQYSIPACPD